MSEPTTASGRAMLDVLTDEATNRPVPARIRGLYISRIAAIEAEARALLLDELEAAVRELPTVPWFKPETGLKADPDGHFVDLASALALIQQYREAIR